MLAQEKRVTTLIGHVPFEPYTNSHLDSLTAPLIVTFSEIQKEPQGNISEMSSYEQYGSTKSHMKIPAKWYV